MGFDTWDEIRTAYQVARLGTVSGAADVLGVHHATVIRHIDALETRLGAKLFQRHARGYTATEAGRELLEVAKGASDRFDQLASRIKGQNEEVSGELVVTAISGIPRLLTPAVVAFGAAHPKLTLRFLTDMRLFRLSSGEAHVAIRAGARPEDADYVVQKFTSIRMGLYAAKAYVEAHGLPRDESELAGHRFVGADDPQARAPFYQWLRQTHPEASIPFRISESAAAEAAVRAGAGLGFLSSCDVGNDPELVQVLPPRPEWSTPLWLVTHVDLHRTLKVQKFLAHLKEAAATWPDT